MITKIIRRASRYYKYVYAVYDEDTANDFGIIGLNTAGEVLFLVTEDKYMNTAEMGIIFEFMDRLQRVANGENLDTLADEYFFNETRQAQSTNTPRKQQSKR